MADGKLDNVPIHTVENDLGYSTFSAGNWQHRAMLTSIDATQTLVMKEKLRHSCGLYVVRRGLRQGRLRFDNLQGESNENSNMTCCRSPGFYPAFGSRVRPGY